MKPRKLFSKLFPTYLFISLVGLIVLTLITRFTFSNFYFEETKTNLIEKARLMEEEISSLLDSNKQLHLSERLKVLGRLSDNRITVILPNGLVIADTSFNPLEMENHAERVEIKAALLGNIGEASRFSPTLEENFVYVAIPLMKNGEIIGVLRNAVTKSKLESSLASLTRKTIVWSFVLLLFLTYLIYVQAKRISAPLEVMKRQVELFAAGEFSQNLELQHTSSIEISSLFSSINSMSEKIQQQFKKINKQKNEQLAVFASMLEGVITISPDMTIYHINNSALRLFNATSTVTVRGSSLISIVKSDSIVELAKKLMEDDEDFTAEIRTSGTQILGIHGTILKSQNSEKLGAVLVFNDVTKLIELETHRTEFVANVSHELKTPLTAIQGYLETLQGEVLDDKSTVIKFLGIIHKHSNRLKTIIEDLLALSSIEKDSDSDGLKLYETLVDPLISNVISLCHSKASEKNLEIEYVPSGISLKMNPALIEQALINLLDNAISYNPKDAKILVCSKIEGNNVLLQVQDFGVGVDKIHHDRLFERFYSVDKARSRELGGSGLGLSIVKHIALSHNGNVKLDSIPGEGALFSIILPLT